MRKKLIFLNLTLMTKILMSDIVINVKDTTSNELRYSLDPKEDDKKEKTSSLCLCFGSIFIFIFALGIIAGVVCYYYFGIKYLVEYKDVNSECNSEIWSYVLVSLILSLVLGGSNAQNSKSESSNLKICNGVITSLIWLGVGIWGIVLSQNESCQEIIDTPLWTFSNVISIIQTVLGSMLFLLWCCLGLCHTSD